SRSPFRLHVSSGLSRQCSVTSLRKKRSHFGFTVFRRCSAMNQRRFPSTCTAYSSSVPSPERSHTSTTVPRLPCHGDPGAWETRTTSPSFRRQLMNLSFKEHRLQIRFCGLLGPELSSWNADKGCAMMQKFREFRAQKGKRRTQIAL